MAKAVLSSNAMDDRRFSKGKERPQTRSLGPVRPIKAKALRHGRHRRRRKSSESSTSTARQEIHTTRPISPPAHRDRHADRAGDAAKQAYKTSEAEAPCGRPSVKPPPAFSTRAREHPSRPCAGGRRRRRDGPQAKQSRAIGQRLARWSIATGKDLQPHAGTCWPTAKGP